MSNQKQVKRIVTYTRTWTVEVEGTEENPVAFEGGYHVEGLEGIVLTKIARGTILSDESGIVSTEVVR
jgi:hypothetical protein